MAVEKIYAGSSKTGMTELPSPVSLKPSDEIIWSENTGRAQSGSNKAKMIGDVVDTKKTYTIQWGILTSAEMASIRSKLKAGFFWFGVGTTSANAQNNAIKAYRSNITAEALYDGHYKDATVDVVEQ